MFLQKNAHIVFSYLDQSLRLFKKNRSKEVLASFIVESWLCPDYIADLTFAEIFRYVESRLSEIESKDLVHLLLQNISSRMNDDQPWEFFYPFLQQCIEVNCKDCIHVIIYDQIKKELNNTDQVKQLDEWMFLHSNKFQYFMKTTEQNQESERGWNFWNDTSFDMLQRCVIQ